MAQRIVVLLLVVLLTGSAAPLQWGKNASGTADGVALLSEARNLLARAAINKESEKYLARMVLALGARQETVATRALVELWLTRPPRISAAHDD